MLVVALALVGCASDHGPDSSHSPQAQPVAAMTVTGTVVSSRPWSFDGRPGVEMLTANYRVMLTQPQEALTDQLPSFLESALDQYRSAIADLPVPTSRMETYVFAHRSDWERLTSRLMGPDAAAYLAIRRGGFSTDGLALYVDIGLDDTLMVAAHEGWHQYSQRALRDPLPIWLEEGMAVLFEGLAPANGSDDLRHVRFRPWSNIERFDRLTELVDAGALWPLERLLRAAPAEQLAIGEGEALSYYAQIWALMCFLIDERGADARPQLAAVLQDAADGRLRQRIVSSPGLRRPRIPIGEAVGPLMLVALLERDLSSVEHQFHAFVERITEPGVRERIVQGLDPIGPGSALPHTEQTPDTSSMIRP